MRLWSKGLGKLILPLDLKSSDTYLTPEHIIFSGTIREGKIIWPYTIKMREEDLIAFTSILLRRDVLNFLAQKNGMALLWTIAIGSLRFAWGLIRTLFGYPYPITPEATLELGPTPKVRRGRRPRRIGAGASPEQSSSEKRTAVPLS